MFGERIMSVRNAVAKPVVKPVAKPVAKEEPVSKVRKTRDTENIHAMDFVPVWQKYDSAEDVNEHFGRTGQWASSFASRLRKMKVGLKKMDRVGGGGGKRLNVDELNALL